ncbi:MAG: hypothetical protein RJB26_274 [Pseudomonadota bacterium]|jgi:hypothetical protein
MTALHQVKLDPVGRVVWNGIMGLAERAVNERSRSSGHDIRQALAEWPKRNRPWLAQQLRFCIATRRRWLAACHGGGQ